MIPLLNPLKEKIWLLVAGSIFIVGGLAIGFWQLADNLFKDNSILSLIAVIIAIFIIALIIGRLIASKAIKPTEYLARSILTVRSEERRVGKECRL